jgi:hypothetical protein
MGAPSIVPCPAAVETRVLRDERLEGVPSDKKRKGQDGGRDNAIHDNPEPEGKRPLCARHVDTATIPDASLNASN